MSASHRARLALEEATQARKRAGYLDTMAGQEWDSAYAAWMCARASEGDSFALSLGYTATGWDFDVWARHREAQRARKAG